MNSVYKITILVLLVIILIPNIFGSDNLDITNCYAAEIILSNTNLNTNNISSKFYNNGISDHDLVDSTAGLTFPKGANRTAVYQSGFLIGGKVEDDSTPRVIGAKNSSSLQPGRIISTNWAEDPNLHKNRIYRVRPDIIPPNGPRPMGYQPGSIVSELADNEGTISEIYAQYELDWNEWPANEGAPFIDKNGDGIYSSSVDVPGIRNADQTIWFVSNDLDTSLTQNNFGSLPLGLEIQTTYWAQAIQGAFGNVFFRKYLFINKSESTINDMYISMWSDPDIGSASNDFAGCDTVLNLAYAYNAQSADPIYTPLPPPSVGFCLLQGPLKQGIAGEDLNKNGIPDNMDYGIYNWKNIGPGMINLPMTAFYYHRRPIPEPPTQAEIFYNSFRGIDHDSSNYYRDPITGNFTTYALNGNPSMRTGWLDGMTHPAGERRIGLASGTFEMAIGDTQEIVIAEILAGAIPGVDPISSVGLLKFYTSEISRSFYSAHQDTILADIKDFNPTAFKLFQNYPNPFNPSTKIKFEVPADKTGPDLSLRLLVYDILGNEVAMLMNEIKPPGVYEIEFSQSAVGKKLSSGVYFYRLTMGNFSDTKKMVLLK